MTKKSEKNLFLELDCIKPMEINPKVMHKIFRALKIDKECVTRYIVELRANEERILNGLAPCGELENQAIKAEEIRTKRNYLESVLSIFMTDECASEQDGEMNVLYEPENQNAEDPLRWN